MEDQQTVDYFDRYTPEYSDYRLKHVLDALNRHAAAGCRLADVGCGVGNILECVKAKTPIQDLCGIDVSAGCLQKTQQRVGCSTLLGSITDTAFVERVAGQFDFVLLMAVLHHLIGKTRKQSKARAASALANCVTLLKPGGRLVISEPIFYPRFTMHALFYVKKAISSVTTRRIPILGYWNNIGAPVVSYYTDEELVKMLKRTGQFEVEEHYQEPLRVSALLRAALVTRRLDVTVVARKLA